MVAGKVTLVTRAGAGIGRATALTFAEEGAKVVVSDFDADGGLETTELVRKAGGDATSIRADVSKAADVGAMVAHALTTYGRLDCACNNAGIEGRTAPMAFCTHWAHWRTHYVGGGNVVIWRSEKYSRVGGFVRWV